MLVASVVAFHACTLSQHTTTLLVTRRPKYNIILSYNLCSIAGLNIDLILLDVLPLPTADKAHPIRDISLSSAVPPLWQCSSILETLPIPENVQL